MDENLSMKDFENELNRSFQKMYPGDLVTGTVIGISDAEVTVDLNYYTEGIIPASELSNNPHFCVTAELSVGDPVTCVVVSENREGALILSRKQAENILSWDTVAELAETGVSFSAKISETVPAGAIAYVHGLKGFIPASQLALNYVEDPSVYLGQEVQVVVLTADRVQQKLVLSAKTVLKKQEEEAYNRRVSSLCVGSVTEGIVESIMPYGAFVSIGNGLSGLLHISQISNKRLKSPNEVLKVGQTVVVKLIDVKNGKISLSMRAAEESDEIEDTIEEVSEIHYSSGDAPAPTLGDLFSKLNLKL